MKKTVVNQFFPLDKISSEQTCDSLTMKTNLIPFSSIFDSQIKG